MPSKNGQEKKVKLGTLVPSAKAREQQAYHWDSEEFSERWPALYEFLAAAVDEDGQVRHGGSLILFCESGRFKCCLIDKHTLQKSFISLNAADSLYDVLEGYLIGGAEWRDSSKNGGGKPVF